MVSNVGLENYWIVECYDVDGRLKWRDEYANLVVTAGLNKILDACFKTGLTSPIWYVGLVDAAGTQSYAAADTMSSHAGWAENVSYAAAVRATFTPGTVAAGSVDNATVKASFTMNASGTLAGCFMTDSNVKSGTSGILYGEGNFSGGDRTFVSLDTVNVTVTLTAAQLA